jgi:hypothetical protein
MHPKKQLEEIYKNYVLFGQYRNIVIGKDNVIIAGTGLYLALKENGVEEVEIERREDLDESDRKRLMIADNRLYEIGATNNDALQKVFFDLKESGKLDIPGYDKELLDSLYFDTKKVDEKIAEYGKPTDDDIEKLKREETRVNSWKGKGTIELTNEDIKVEVDENRQNTAYIFCKKCGEKICL